MFTFTYEKDQFEGGTPWYHIYIKSDLFSIQTSGEQILNEINIFNDNKIDLTLISCNGPESDLNIYIEKGVVTIMADGDFGYFNTNFPITVEQYQSFLDCLKQWRALYD